ncbi:hypothetical protein HYPSUDRAFT_192615 [Hypholoma sublateritium FD-334 SS-4]|uniref:Amidohydrolase-related domain-containing protein n=1 Tax=Hypholoma sublateritium (strain FD-334 SS-4) TaxID=945553 RepID=A0A0D2P995_HYPSF|nr:hypothetical protein HYPSUDRAFT_192615 [Hypholoma sublateritium FD-334 SS-4]
MATTTLSPSRPVEGSIVVQNVHLPLSDAMQAAQRWTVECFGGKITKISPSEVSPSLKAPTVENFERPNQSFIDGTNSLILPSLCHSHIHLDKCFILDRCGDLIKGDFAEAMQVTKLAKAGFRADLEDLYNRGARIIRESVQYGVTSMRAHAEVDTSVEFACLEAAQRLQRDYRTQCDVQIAIFAQEPLFASRDATEPGENWALLKSAASLHGVRVVGSAPYVEPTVELAKKNISLIFDLADAHGLGLIDFHLDYNLDPSSEPLIYEVIAQAKRRYCIVRATSAPQDQHAIAADAGVPRQVCPRITIGHATRLQLFTQEEWRALAAAAVGIPLTLVGLPQSDMYMQGRTSASEPLGAPRGTLRVPHLAREHGFDVAMAVNNVANAFTPQGSLDPLTLCTFGVGVFQAATLEDVRTLARSVSITSKLAIGLSEEDVPGDLALRVGDRADFVILHGHATLQSVVLNPSFDRTTVKAGTLVAYTRSSRWLLT